MKFSNDKDQESWGEMADSRAGSQEGLTHHPTTPTLMYWITSEHISTQEFILVSRNYCTDKVGQRKISYTIRDHFTL